MILFDLKDAARIHGGRTIFRGLSWSVQDGEKIGVIGPSGCGKSTLMDIIAAVEPPDAGAVTFRRGVRVAHLPQAYAGQPGRTALDEVLSGKEDLARIEDAIASAEAGMAEPGAMDDPDTFDALLARHARLLAEFDAHGGAQARSRAERLLGDLGLEEEAWSRPMDVLSGGQRKIVGMARCLLAEPDLLLLDEPDNHLDLRRKAMLERVIRQHTGAVIVISHDRYLLDETVTTIIELESPREGARLVRWNGNYSAYVAQKELAQLRQQQDYTAQQKEIQRLEEAIVRFKEWARIVVDERHIKQARNKQRQIDSMEKVERPALERKKMALRFRQTQRGGAKVAEFRDIDKSFGDNIVLLGAQATIVHGETVGIVGPNGAGKSVLLKLLLGRLEPDAGEVWVGPSIKTGYYSQEHETLDFRQTAVQAIRDVKPMFEGEAVAALARFLIPYEAAIQPIATMSGGEKSRVQLARLMQTGANCLVLDEPTNNLDIPAAEVLEAALEAFPGTVIVVSHDRYLLDRLADRVIEVRDGELHSFAGGYTAYEEARSAKAVTPSETHAAPVATAPASRPRKPARSAAPWAG